MTAADVNVAEKAREAALARWALGSSDTTQMLIAVDAALAVLRSPEVVAGIAGVVLAEQYPAHDSDDLSDDWQVRQAEVVAQAVVDWLTGGGR